MFFTIFIDFNSQVVEFNGEYYFIIDTGFNLLFSSALFIKSFNKVLSMVLIFFYYFVGGVCESSKDIVGKFWTFP